MSDLYEKKIVLPPVIGGEGSAGPIPMDRIPDVLPPVLNGSGGVGDMPDQRPNVLPPVIG